MATAQARAVIRFLRRMTAAGEGMDRDLLERFVARREEAAFTALVKRHGSMVLGVCRRVLRDEHDAEDAFQATFFVLARKAGAIGRPEQLGPWLYGVAYRTASKVRAQAARRRARQEPLDDLPVAEPHDGPDEQELRAVLDDELSRLADKYRVPFVLCYLEGLTNDEAAQQLGCPRGTIATRLARARERLRGRLARRGVALSDGALPALLARETVPAATAEVTMKAAVAFAGGGPAAGGLSLSSAALAEGVIRAMRVKLLQACLASVLGLALTGGVGVTLYHTSAAEPVRDQTTDSTKKEKAPDKPKPGEIDRLVRQLGSDRFEEREAASKRLSEIGEAALPALQKVAVAGDDVETRMRAKELVRSIERRKVGELRRFVGHTDPVTYAVFSPDGQYVLSASDDKTARLWDAATGKEVRRFAGHGSMVQCAVFSPDGGRILTSSGWPADDPDKSVRVWDVATGKELMRMVGHTDTVWRVAVSPDGRGVLSVSGDGTLQGWELGTGRVLWQSRAGGKVWRVAFSPDAKLVATGGAGLRLWDVATGREVRRIEGPAASVNGVAFSPDGRTLLSADGGEGRSLRLWDLATGQELRRIEGHTAAIEDVAFSPDGRRILSASSDKTLRLWNTASGREIQRLKGHTDVVRSAHFSPDGRWAVSASHDRTIRLWQLPE